MRVCLLVSTGDDRAGAVRAAVERHASCELEWVAVWGGPPDLRPAAPGGALWIDDDLDEPTGAGWHAVSVACRPGDYAIARAARAIARLLADDQRPTLLLTVGDVAVRGDVAELAVASGLGLVRRIAGELPADGLAPGADDLAAAGLFGTAIVAFGGDASEAAAEVSRLTASGASGGAALALVAADPRWQVATLGHVAVVGWDATAAKTDAFDLRAIDRGDPWRVVIGRRRPRWPVWRQPGLATELAEVGPQWLGPQTCWTLPGGIEIDDTMRALVADALDRWRGGTGELAPDAWRQPAEFVRWLETPAEAWGADVGRYWSQLRSERVDLQVAFPDPAGADRDRFAAWAAGSWRAERRSPLLRVNDRPMRAAWRDVARRTGGVNLIGYHRFDNSLGDVVRRVRACLSAVGVPVAALHYHRSASPAVGDDVELGEIGDELVYDTNLIVLNHDQMRFLEADHGSQLFDDRTSIGYWFWDVEYVPQAVRTAMARLDEIWVASEFTAAALGATTPRPVRVVEVPTPRPDPAPISRERLGLPDGRFVFLVTFDHLSVTERKNPIGAIEAFRRAFPQPDDAGPLLFVKSVNAELRWHEHERLRFAAGDRGDIVVDDRRLDRGAQLALIASADCLVSLHRSEGLGLHMIEAMWVGTPVIATAYSGNLQVMDHSSAALVDAALVPVERGEGYFPPEATWADPDLEQAAAWMRRLVAERPLGAELAAAAQQRIERQLSLAEAGAQIRDRLRQARAR